MAKEKMPIKRLNSSFRDPGGFIFTHANVIYRQINFISKKDYEGMMSSGLYEQLAGNNLLIPHVEVDNIDIPGLKEAYKIIKPQQVPYISYPYEWCFSQLKDAAILTLNIQAIALRKGFSLKDASAYNIQFINGKPIFIDTLSFEPYRQGEPWVGYKQFCQHFLAPLALIDYTDSELSKLLITNIDGIPVTLASKLLPLRSWFKYSMLAHIHMHAKVQQNYADATNMTNVQKTKRANLSLKGLQAMIEGLISTIKRLQWKLPQTEWGDYYQKTNYSDEATTNKHKLVEQFLANIPGDVGVIQDLGANTGEFSRIAAKYGQIVISQDVDPVAVESNYCHLKNQGPHNILPLIQNLFSPSPAIGWSNSERDSFVERGRCDVLLALALIHHLAISNNVPLIEISKLFAKLTTWLIIEFVPKTDSQVKRLLTTRKDIFPNYSQDGFEQSIAPYFGIKIKKNIGGSDRVLYLLKKK